MIVCLIHIPFFLKSKQSQPILLHQNTLINMSLKLISSVRVSILNIAFHLFIIIIYVSFIARARLCTQHETLLFLIGSSTSTSSL